MNSYLTYLSKQWIGSVRSEDLTAMEREQLSVAFSIKILPRPSFSIHTPVLNGFRQMFNLYFRSTRQVSNSARDF
jgi:hypothetical protein